jgi:hypothetical protein
MPNTEMKDFQTPILHLDCVTLTLILGFFKPQDPSTSGTGQESFLI